MRIRSFLCKYGLNRLFSRDSTPHFVRPSVGHSVGWSVGWLVGRWETVDFFSPKGDLTSIIAPAQCTRMMLSCIRPCSLHNFSFRPFVGKPSLQAGNFLKMGKRSEGKFRIKEKQDES